MMPRSQVTHERLVKDKGRHEERSITTPYATRTTTRITATETAVFHLHGDCLPDFNGISWLHARPFVRLTPGLSRAALRRRLQSEVGRQPVTHVWILYYCRDSPDSIGAPLRPRVGVQPSPIEESAPAYHANF